MYISRRRTVLFKNEALLKALNAYKKFAPSRFEDAKELVPKETKLYGHAEYFSSIKQFRFSPQVICNIQHGLSQQVSVYYGRKRYDIKTPKISMISKIDVSYDSNILTLSTNIPFHIYKHFWHLDNLIYWDEDYNCYGATNTLQPELDEFHEDIAKRGILDPITAQLKNGTIVATPDSFGRLEAALFLKLETAPFNIFVSTERYNEFEDLVPIGTYKNKLKKICSPYFLF